MGTLRQIEVAALADGWRVRVDNVANDMVFHSGRAAERAARSLAERLARAGVWSEIRLYLKDGALASRFLSPGRAPLAVGKAPGRERALEAA